MIKYEVKMANVAVGEDDEFIRMAEKRQRDERGDLIKLRRADGVSSHGGGPDEISFHENGSVRFEGWTVNDVYHREDGPARVHYWENGRVKKLFWCLEGAVHRMGGPAVEEFNENGSKISEIWYRYGQMYRLDGPAFNTYDGHGREQLKFWNMNDRDITDEVITLFGGEPNYPLTKEQQFFVKLTLG